MNNLVLNLRKFVNKFNLKIVYNLKQQLFVINVKMVIIKIPMVNVLKIQHLKLKIVLIMILIIIV